MKGTNMNTTQYTSETMPNAGAYKLEVSAIGYENKTMWVYATSLRDAKRFEREAIKKWCAHNDIDEDSADLGFVHISKDNSVRN